MSGKRTHWLKISAMMAGLLLAMMQHVGAQDQDDDDDDDEDDAPLVAPAPKARTPIPAAKVPAANAPGQAGAELPAFIKPGSRITFHAGDSVLRGTRLVHDPKFGMIKKPDGWYRPEEGRSGGGVGLAQVNIQFASPEFIAADIANFLNVDLQNNIVVSSGAAPVTGNAAALGKYWINPGRLAQIQDGEQPDGTLASHGVYQLENQQFDVITLRSSLRGHHAIHSYDIRSGILISGGTIDAEDGVMITDPNGVMQGAVDGSTVMSHIRFAGMRDVSVPWAGAPTPQWIAKGSRFEYQGGSRAVIPGGEGLPPLPPVPASVSTIVNDVVQGCAITTLVQRLSQGAGLPPSEATAQRCFGPAMFNGLWIAPQAVGNLQPNQVLDQDPLTGYRVLFIGVQGPFVGIVEQGPQEAIERYYDAQTGLLMNFRITRVRPNIGQQITEYQLVGRQ